MLTIKDYATPLVEMIEVKVEDGFEAFYKLREIAQNNGFPDMTLDEIKSSK